MPEEKSDPNGEFISESSPPAQLSAELDPARVEFGAKTNLPPAKTSEVTKKPGLEAVTGGSHYFPTENNEAEEKEDAA